MRIMVLGIRGLPKVQGGVETHAEHLYPRLVELGCEVHAIVRTAFVARGQREFSGVRLHRLWAPRRSGFEALVHSVLGVLYAGIARPDILHIHAIGPAIVTPVARLLGLTVVVTHHGMDYEREKWGAFARGVLRLGERAGMQSSQARIVISRAIRDAVTARYGVEAQLIPNGVPLASEAGDSGQLRRLGLEPGRYFLQVGRLVPEKRQLDLIQAYASQKRSWRLAVVGALEDSEYAARVAQCANIDGLVLAGYQSGEALRQLYAHAGAFVLPSSHEGLPIAMLEALSHGLPVLASNIAANLEVGLEPASYFPLGNIAALADGLTRLQDAPADLRARAQRRRWTAEKYDWDRIARETLEVYRQARSQR
jgi:glycosyltransferase involved in cell wall biosynthesis